MALVFVTVLAWLNVGGDEKPPVVGRPPGFGGAVGDFRSITTSANPTDLEAETPLMLTVRIIAEGLVKPPRHFDLRTQSEFARDFLIEELPDSQKRNGVLEFRYRLRPLNVEVTEIPAIRFDYFRPGFVPPEKGYQTRYSEPIPLKVHPRRPAALDDATMTSVPESAYQIKRGSGILRHDEPNAVPWSALIVVAAAAPLALVGYCVLRSHRYLLLAISLASISAIDVVDPSPDVAVLERAEAAFQRGLENQKAPLEARAEFAAAAADYQTLRRHGYRSADLFRNEGNAWLLSGDAPRAILAYRLALRLSPWDRDTRTNLRFARGQVTPPMQTAAGWLSRMMSTPATLVVLAIGGYSATWLFLTWWWFRNRRSYIYGALSGAMLAGLAIGALLVVQHQQQRDAAHPVVVITVDDVTPRTGDGKLYPPSGSIVLHRGAEARLLFTREHWLQIELVDGSVGWVPREQTLVGSFTAALPNV